jgi:TDG/mug DNA glycosylase family protein
LAFRPFHRPRLVSWFSGACRGACRNAFWKVVAERNSDLPSDYARRVAVLIEHHIALWDVLAAATRTGSLDADIASDAIPNNFRAFFHIHPHIKLVCFNGRTAARLYERHVLPTLPNSQRAIARDTLPSTSGAHASLPFAKKVARWSVVFGDALFRCSLDGCQKRDLSLV